MDDDNNEALRGQKDPARIHTKFCKRSFELVCPKLDSSIARRLKEVKLAVASSAEANEKMMLALQYKMLDVARPLLFIRNEFLSNTAREPLVRAAESALKM